MNTLGIYVYNASRDAWLQDNERSWGPFSDAIEYTEGNEELAEAVRLRVTKNDDATYTMVVLS